MVLHGSRHFDDPDRRRPGIGPLHLRLHLLEFRLQLEGGIEEIHKVGAGVDGHGEENSALLRCKGVGNLEGTQPSQAGGNRPSPLFLCPFETGQKGLLRVEPVETETVLDHGRPFAVEDAVESPDFPFPDEAGNLLFFNRQVLQLR